MNFEYDYQLLSDQLIALGAICSVAELQGMLCGQLACGKTQSDDEWVEQAREFSDLTHFEMTDDQRAIILFLLEASENAITDDSFAFQPLLPDDACPLVDRAAALGAWCRGFLHGFGVSGIAQDTELPAEIVEVIRDLAKISEAVKTVEEEEDETDNDWFELVEYVRTAVLTVHAELATPSSSAAPSTADKPSIH